MTAKARKRSPRSVREPQTEIARVVPLPKRRASIQAATATTLEGDRVRLSFGPDDEADARLAPSLDPIVVRTAIERRETVIVQEGEEGYVVLGVLRTAPTPGVDKGDEYVIEARRLHLNADHELSLVSGASQIALRAIGMVETIATSITSRASSVHKIIGRMLHLN
jgi:hypothetical protein